MCVGQGMRTRLTPYPLAVLLGQEENLISSTCFISVLGSGDTGLNKKKQVHALKELVNWWERQARNKSINNIKIRIMKQNKQRPGN